MQSFTCTGNVVKDVEAKIISNGRTVCSILLAVRRPHSGETDFFNVEVWGKQAENCEKFLPKGKKVGIVGFIKTRSYTDKEGVHRTLTDIVADQVEFLTPKPLDSQTTEPTNKAKFEPINEDDLPF